ncbi:hypothetical protein Leryth_022627 [Lithospermum erythrorhizon]|uniref:peptidylprolyl isomerase n=1 Tax=Lithospermum erythrorhizon TaxID=34254 RepID=A0AAV3P5Z6_LITER|nr:hypothetical protein Leryth_022627 [Lithospermum erythrorhizon]
MATSRITTTMMMSPSRHSPPRNVPIYKHVPLCPNATKISIKTSSLSQKRLLVIAASEAASEGSGLQAAIPDSKENLVSVKNPTIVLEYRDEYKVHVRVDVTREDTKYVFDRVLTNLAKTAPPVPGFRRQKGGKTSKVPKEIMLQILGESSVKNFVIQEIVTSTLADYVKNENLSVKDNKVTTVQSADELKGMFTPGNVFGFNAVIQLEADTAVVEETVA